MAAPSQATMSCRPGGSLDSPLKGANSRLYRHKIGQYNLVQSQCLSIFLVNIYSERRDQGYAEVALLKSTR